MCTANYTTVREVDRVMSSIGFHVKIEELLYFLYAERSLDTDECSYHCKIRSRNKLASEATSKELPG